MSAPGRLSKLDNFLAYSESHRAVVCAVAPLPARFHIGAQIPGGAMAAQHAIKDRQIRLHILALQRVCLKAEELARAFVGQRDRTLVIQRQNRQRAGFDQNAYLHLRFAAHADLFLAFRQVLL